jgi:hypothetical protein
MAVKLPGGSNTPQDFAAQAMSNLGALVRLGRLHAPHSAGAAAGALVGSAFGAPGTIIGGWLGHAAGAKLAAFRNAGFTKVDQIVKEAMLDPKLASALLQKASNTPRRGFPLALANALRRSALALPASAGHRPPNDLNDWFVPPE